tara:strand:- start:208 stop:339 length:132 start_codon:yes stop_codon:yes gene_type:complete
VIVKNENITLSSLITQLETIKKKYGEIPLREVYIKIATGGGKK